MNTPTRMSLGSVSKRLEQQLVSVLISNTLCINVLYSSAKNGNWLSLFNFLSQFLDFSSKFLPAPLFSDVTIKGNLLPQNSQEPAETCSELETYLAEKFKMPSSDQSKKMRKELQGVYIVLVFVCFLVYLSTLSACSLVYL